MCGLSAAIEAHFSSGTPNTLGVAVSGGGDSMALLALLCRYGERNQIALHCATVDHGLRPEAAAEARMVAAFCARHDVPHSILKWSGWNGEGNLQNAARRARYALLGDWARSQGIADIVLGHTQDDQAETVLMRLGRAAGVDGLSAMAARREAFGVVWHRPLLGVTRAALRGFLQDQRIDWCDDPSNEDAHYDRIKARCALGTLAELGIDRAALAQVARNMAQARHALDHQTMQAIRDLVDLRGGGAAICWLKFNALPSDIARRLALAAIDWITASDYPPRQKALGAALAAVKTSGSATLAGCRFLRDGDTLWVFREYQAVAEKVGQGAQLWDDRWCIRTNAPRAGHEIRALGEKGLAQCPDWRATGLPRALLLATPAVWEDTTLIAAPVAQSGSGCSAELKKTSACLFDKAFGH